MFYVVSACLAGFRCRYDGKYQGNPIIESLFVKGYVLPVCPELLGGMGVPRIPCERDGQRIVSKEGHDYTYPFFLGAAKAFLLMQGATCQGAILKARSPSCGVDMIYDGSFSKTMVCGDGVFAALLRQYSIPIYTEENFLHARDRLLCNTIYF